MHGIINNYNIQELNKVMEMSPLKKFRLYPTSIMIQHNINEVICILMKNINEVILRTYFINIM